MSIESEKDLKGLARVGKIVSLVIAEMKKRLRTGMTTAELDEIGAAVLEKHGARSAPQLIYNFPGKNLISINDEVVHGVPGQRIIRAGDLVSIDVTAELDGYMADAAVTVAVPPVSSLMRNLCICVESAFFHAIRAARVGWPVNGIGRAVEKEVNRRGFSVIHELNGHGIGKAIHEGPTVPNFYDPEADEPLTEGLVITIEPIISSGSARIVQDPDGWTIKTRDCSLSAHYEHTIVITKDRPILLTAA